MANKKYFVFDEGKRLSKEDNLAVMSRTQDKKKELDKSTWEKSGNKISEEDSLTHAHNRILVKIDLENKNKWKLSENTVIRYERQFNNFNKRETEPVNCIVISGEGIPKDTEILIHPNAIHDSNRIFDYKNDIGDVKYYSIPKDMCFAYFDERWRPLPGFEFALQVFKPYTGFLVGVDPELIENCLYVTTGELTGKAVMTLKACAYIIVFQGKDLREERIIRFRPYGDEETKREPEAIAILNDVTDKINNGEYWVGIDLSDAKPLEITAYAD